MSTALTLRNRGRRGADWAAELWKEWQHEGIAGAGDAELGRHLARRRLAGRMALIAAGEGD